MSITISYFYVIDNMFSINMYAIYLCIYNIVYAYYCVTSICNQYLLSYYIFTQALPYSYHNPIQLTTHNIVHPPNRIYQ